jgi:hypothetical protein
VFRLETFVVPPVVEKLLIKSADEHATLYVGKQACADSDDDVKNAAINANA